MNWRTDEETPCIKLKKHCCLSYYNLNHWPTNWFRGARSFLTSRQFISLLGNFPQLVKTEGSLPSVKLFSPWIFNLYFRSVYQLTALTRDIAVWIRFMKFEFHKLIYCFYIFYLLIFSAWCVLPEDGIVMPKHVVVKCNIFYNKCF
jgi:hypothetical protein